MAPDISKVNADRCLNPELSAGHFCDDVMRCLFYGNSLSDLKNLLIPFRGANHFLATASASFCNRCPVDPCKLSKGHCARARTWQIVRSCVMLSNAE
jgi:hypothetical protein